MSLPILLESDIQNQEEIIKEVIAVFTDHKCSKTIGIHDDYDIPKSIISLCSHVEDCIKNQIPFQVMYNYVDSVVQEKNLYIYTFYWREGEKLIIDCYKRIDLGKYDCIDKSDYSKEQIRIRNLLAKV